MLLLIHKNYNKTRLNKDDGIDGYTLLRNKQPFVDRSEDGSRKEGYEFFSIYGPEAKTDWADKKAKITRDLNNIVQYSMESQSKILKWFLVTNFDFKHSYEVEIAEMCKEVGVEYELYYPQKIISLLDTPEHIYKALAFVDQAPATEKGITRLHFPDFAKESLRLLVEYEERQTTEQLELVNSLEKFILLYIFDEEYLNSNSNRVTTFYISKLLKQLTNIPNKKSRLFHQYTINQKKFFTYEFDEANALGISNDADISKNDIGDFTLYIKDLRLLFWIVVQARNMILELGTYSLSKVLTRIYRQQENIRRARANNRLA